MENCPTWKHGGSSRLVSVVITVTMVIVVVPNSCVVGPLPNGCFMAYIWGLLTAYWDDPPSTPPFFWGGFTRCKVGLGSSYNWGETTPINVLING